MLQLLAMLAGAVSASSATEHAPFDCASNAPQIVHTQLVYIYNQGLNPVRLHPVVDNVTYACSDLLPANVTDFKVNVSANATEIGITYHSTQLFSYHALQRPENATVAFPTADIYVPYPKNGSMLCDSDADCPQQGKCSSNSHPPTCEDPTPKPPTPPKPDPTPAPVPVPTAS